MSAPADILLLGGDNGLAARLEEVLAGAARVLLTHGEAAVDNGVALLLVDARGAVLDDVLAGVARPVAVPMLVLGDEGDATFVLDAVRAGARDVVDPSCDDARLRAHLLRHLARRPVDVESGAKGRLHLILGGLPGTTAQFALNYALLRAMAAGEALLMDCTAPWSLAGTALDLRVHYTMGDAVHDLDRMDRALLGAALAIHQPSGLRLLPLATPTAEGAHAPSATAIAALVRRALPLFGELIFDAGDVRHAPLLRELLAIADVVYLVVNQTIASVQGARLLIDTIETQGAAEHIGLVVDDYQPAIMLDAERIAQTLGLPRTVIVPAAPAALANALNEGRPLVLQAPASPYAQAVGIAAGLDAPRPQPITARIAGRVREMLG